MEDKGVEIQMEEMEVKLIQVKEIKTSRGCIQQIKRNKFND